MNNSSILKDRDNRTEKMKMIYAKAKEFLYEMASEELQREELKRYFDVQKTFKTKNDILYGLLNSLQNRSMVSRVIGFGTEKRALVFENLLFAYDCNLILKAYTCETLFDIFNRNFTIKNAESKRNLWKGYAKSIISACMFLKCFKDANNFDEFVMRFSYNEFSSAALPMLLEREIFWLGFPLACDFLKELGYVEYPKPDIHIKEIFYAFDLCENSDYATYKAVIEMAKIVGDTPYNVDKTFWLIGSGNYYLHNNIPIKKNREKFIKRVAPIL